MEKKTRYTLTAAIGDKLAGSSVDLTDAQAASPLYASRVALVGGEADASASYEDVRAAVLAELEGQVPEFLANAKAEGSRLVEEGRTSAAALVKEADEKLAAANEEAKRLIDSAKAEATTIVSTAQAEAMKLAATGKK